jgi:CO/xanthine dehydrogenase FAD-binding subunit
MSVLLPETIDDVRAALAAHPDGTLLAGGTDWMVECNAGHRRPTTVIALRRCAELRTRVYDQGRVFLGAATTYADLAAPDVATAVPALAQAARTVGSPQIRAAGTLGGNLATASPAGDTLPVLAALDADVHLLAADGTQRQVPWRDFFVGPKRTVRRTDELVVGTSFAQTSGAQEYLKVGTRNAMVISVAGLALIVDTTTRTVRVGLGSVGPVPLRAPDAEQLAASELAWDRNGYAPALPSTGGDALVRAFAAAVAGAARAIDDHRATAAYRRHAVSVLAARALQRATDASTATVSTASASTAAAPADEERTDR